jgi:hypothetical protein
MTKRVGQIKHNTDLPEMPVWGGIWLSDTVFFIVYPLR